MHGEALFVSVGGLLDELVRGGLREVVVCPGSRSTPLALLAAQQANLRLLLHLDERSAGFFALGLAKAAQRPVALICTSGTAAANFLPAVAEARLSRVPLLVLTADRPPELRDNGAPQTIDQLRLFGPHTKWFAEVALPEASPAAERYARTLAARALHEALSGPAGPVQLNLPFREPLIPQAPANYQPLARDGAEPFVATQRGAPHLSAAQFAPLVARLAQTQRGMIVVGPEAPPELAPSLTRLAARLGFPILADPLSGLRRGHHDLRLVLGGYDAFLRDQEFAQQHAPELVLRFGAMPTSKPLLLFLQRHAAAEQWVIDRDGGWREPTNLAARHVQAEEAWLCDALETALAGEAPLAGEPLAAAPAPLTRWSRPWLSAERITRETIDRYFAQLEAPFEGAAIATLANLLPEGAGLFLGNSMPIRDGDLFIQPKAHALKIFGNRGANGIDGLVSSALGAAAAGISPMALAIGDISLYHDANGLLAAKRFGLQLTILVLNNDGGGIFHFLPQAEQPEHFETLFGTPHGLSFGPLAEFYGAGYRHVTQSDELAPALEAALAAGGLQIVELQSERQRNLAQHRALWPRLSAALHK